MLKKYTISVDGKSYEVEVEDVTAGSSANVRPSQAAYAAEPALASAPASPEAKAVPAPKAPASVPAAPADFKGEILRAPMPGTILSVSASVGQSVKRGEILLILEAMKMENEIVSHIDGTISGIYVQKGSTVNAGDTLVAYV